MWGQFNIWRSVNVIHHISKLKKSTRSPHHFRCWKSLWQMQPPFRIKVPEMIGIEEYTSTQQKSYTHMHTRDTHHMHITCTNAIFRRKKTTWSCLSVVDVYLLAWGPYLILNTVKINIIKKCNQCLHYNKMTVLMTLWSGPEVSHWHIQRCFKS